uniref:Uncharacterized protein n=1 Tax=Trichuris muris TaxID=70415 RepID=A0A5S6QIU4_TRIMR
MAATRIISTWFGVIHASGQKASVLNRMCDYSAVLSLVPENQAFIGCSFTRSAVYFVTDDGTVIRCNFTSKAITDIHVFCLETGEWEKDDSLVTVTSLPLPATRELLPHLGSFVIPVDNVDAQADFEYLLVCTDQRAYLVKQEEKRSRLYLIDSPNFNSVIHISMDVPEGRKIVRALAGYAFIMLLDSAGRLHSFGCGTRGELGHGSLESLTEPLSIQYFDGIRIVDIAVGGWHTLAVTEAGAVYAWGWNESGQLGLNRKECKVVDLPTVVPIREEDRPIAVACGSRHSLILSERNSLYAFGWNGYGQLDFSSLTAVRPNNDEKWAQLFVSDPTTAKRIKLLLSANDQSKNEVVIMFPFNLIRMLPFC